MVLGPVGCTASAGDPPETVRVPSAEVIIGGGGVRVGTPANEVGIPPGHLPPPGACHASVPPGAVLVRGR
jgi:hypothetical protein